MVIDDYVVEWDFEKNESNNKKHHVNFETAAYIFKDENRLEWFDDQHSVDEDRFFTIGRVGNVLFVVYTERGKTIRLISARIATKEEEELYYGNC